MDTIGCTPIQLEEPHVREIRDLIANLPVAVESSATANDINLERFEKLIMLYSDEPQLLDSILKELVQTLVPLISWPNSDHLPLSPLSLAALSRLRVVTRTRGYKVMIRVLPHEVDYLLRILFCLEYYADRAAKPSTSNDSDRRIIFMLTVWLLIICKNPFNLAKFDGANQNSSSLGPKPVAQRIIDCMTTLQIYYIPQGELTVVCTLLAQILTRNNDNSAILKPRMLVSLNVLNEFDSETDGGRVLITHLRWFLLGKRKEMRQYALELLNTASGQLLNMDCVNIEVRNLVTKLLQRVALVLLKPKLASWRYKCGFRSLEEILSQAVGVGEKNESDGPAQRRTNDDEDLEQDGAEDIPYKEIEAIISEVLLKINDRDNVVRWTAAKGIARICSRLPRELAAEVVASILSSSFDERTMVGGTWHGGCLALAELCRRGCLLPDQVPKVVHLLSKALLFEQSHIGFSVSVNVRDAACYICWAFARAYEASVLRPHLHLLAGELVCLALFDREVNIRRAASAAFQENVGRNDSLPEGIRVLTIIDYVDVALIRKCYLELAVRVAEYKEYRVPMLDHLLRLKSQHWDEAIRELAADSMQRLVSSDVDYSRDVLLPQLCARLNDKDPTVGHGTLFSLAGALIGLHQSGNLSIHSLPQLSTLMEVVPKTLTLLKDHRVKGYTLLSKAVCRFIQALCAVGTVLSDKQLREFHDALDSVVGDKNKKLHEYAASAFSDMMNYYEGDRFGLLLERVSHKYFVAIEGPCQDELLRSASIVPLAHIPSKFLGAQMDSGGALSEAIVTRLLRVVYDKSTPKWVFARVAAVETLCSILSTLSAPAHNSTIWVDVMEGLIHLSDDYTSTVNGDIGRFGRRASVIALGRVLPLCFSSLPSSTLNLAVGKIIQRCCETIDDLRYVGCSTMTTLLERHSELQMGDRELLNEVFCLSLCSTPRASEVPEMKAAKKEQKEKEEEFSAVDWKHSKGFMRLGKLLGSEVYQKYALEGFILSAGSVSEWMSQSALLAIVEHLRPIKKDIQAMELFLQDVLTIFHRLKQRSDPGCVLQLLRMLLIERVFAVYEKDPDAWKVFMELSQEVMKLALERGKPKIKSLAIQVVGCLLQVNPHSQLYHRCISLVVSILESPYSSLREVAVEQLFEVLNGLLDDSFYSTEMQQRALEVLTQAPWSSSGNEAELLNKAKEELYGLLIPSKASA